MFMNYFGRPKNFFMYKIAVHFTKTSALKGNRKNYRLGDVNFVVLLLAADSSGQQHVSDHNGDPLCMNRAQIAILENSKQVCFCAQLECIDNCALVPTVLLQFTCDVFDQSLEKREIGSRLEWISDIFGFDEGPLCLDDTYADS